LRSCCHVASEWSRTWCRWNSLDLSICFTIALAWLTVWRISYQITSQNSNKDTVTLNKVERFWSQNVHRNRTESIAYHSVIWLSITVSRLDLPNKIFSLDLNNERCDLRTPIIRCNPIDSNTSTWVNCCWCSWFFRSSSCNLACDTRVQGPSIDVTGSVPKTVLLSFGELSKCVIQHHVVVK
jgi:uncharacterized membrane protein